MATRSQAGRRSTETFSLQGLFFSAEVGQTPANRYSRKQNFGSEEQLEIKPYKKLKRQNFKFWGGGRNTNKQNEFIGEFVFQSPGGGPDAGLDPPLGPNNLDL